jgi:RimJ/RimL family protein N-acetyltransferase
MRLERIAERLEGRIVVLEPLRAEHEDGLWEASRDPRTWRWLSILQPQTREKFSAFFDDALDDPAMVPFATVSASTGRVLGSTRFLSVRPDARSLEIGWTWLHPDAWGAGANTEAKYLQLRHAFETLGALRVELKTDALNERSRAALAALPAQFEGVHRKHMLVRGGERRDSAWYSVLDDEWPEVKANLERRIESKLATG